MRSSKDTGLFFPIDPGANATIGGMSSTRASGTNAVRYGTMRENVLGLTVVLADGRVIQYRRPGAQVVAPATTSRACSSAPRARSASSPKSQCGCTASRKSISAAVCQFPDLKSAVDSVIVAMQLGIPVARIEFLDDVQMDACIRYSQLDGVRREADAVLRVPRHGRRRARTGGDDRGDRRPTTAAATSTGRRSPKNARGSGRRATTRITPRWRWRPASRASRPMPACRSRGSPTACSKRRPTSATTGLVAPIVGHVGDGNFHLVILFDPANPDERSKAEALARAGQHCARSPWAAHAPASTASACTSSPRWQAEHGDAIG